MTDKVQKIREEVERLMYGFNLEADIASCEDAETEELANIKYQLCKKILDYIDKVQEEPVSENLERYINELSKQFPEVSFAKLSRIAVRVSRWQQNQDVKNKLPKVTDRTELDEYAYQCAYNMSNDWAIDNPTWHDVEDACKLGAKWQKQQDSIQSKDLEELINTLSKRYPEVSFAKLSRIAVKVAKWQKEKEYTCYEEAFEDGAKWKVENLWKPADGDDLPDIGREVIVLIKDSVQRNIHAKEYLIYRIGFGHRPNPDGWDGKNIDTDEVTHYTPKLYDKGGWNAPNIAYWLDVELPKEIEL